MEELLFSVVLVFGFLIWLAYKASKALKKSGKRLGQNLHGDAHFQTLDEVRRNGLLNGGGIPLGDHYELERVIADSTTNEPQWPVPPPKQEKAKAPEYTFTPIHYKADRHLLTIAPSRSGKGTTAIIPTLLEHDASMLVIDPKGQNAAVTARRRREMGHEVYVLNPFGLHSEPPWDLPQHCYNPLAAIDPNGDSLIADVAALCEALVITEGNEPHWPDSARMLVSSLIMHLLMTKGRDATLPELREILGRTPADFVRYMGQEVAQSPHAFVRARGSRFVTVQNDNKEVESILSSALTQTAFLDDPVLSAALSGSDFQFADLKRRKMTVYLILPSRYLSAYARWLRLLVVSAINALTSTTDKPQQPVLLVLDEMASLGHLSAIETAAALAAGYHVQLWGILQDTNQVRAIYGDRWETFMANSGMIQIFAPNDMTTADYFQRRAGTLTFESASLSVGEITRQQLSNGFSGQTKSYQQVAVPLCPAHDLLGWPARSQVIFLAGDANPISSRRRPYYENAAYAGMFDPDPFHI